MGKATDVVQAEQPTPVVESDKTEALVTPIRAADTSVRTATFTPPTPLPSDGTTPVKVENDGRDKPANMTQADLDKVIAARLEQERKKYADYDAIKAELAKLKTPATETPAAPNNLEVANQGLIQKNRELAIEAAVVKAASAIGLDAAAAAKLVNASDIAIGEDGKLSGVEDAVKTVAERYPGLLVRQFARVRPANPGTTGDPAVRTDADRRSEYFGGRAGSFWSGGGVVTND